MTAPTIQTGLRAATLSDLATLLQDHHARRVDVVAPADKLAAGLDGLVRVEGTEPVLTDDGVTLGDGLYLPTDHALGQMAEKLKIPAEYLRRMHRTHVELWRDNINGWLTHEEYRDRKYLVRALRGDDGTAGVMRAFLSDSYRVIDNLDVLMAALDGVRDAGVQVDIPQGGVDLTDSRMYVKFWAPQVQANAETLVQNYRSPFHFGIDRAGEAPRDNRDDQGNPVVFAGFVLSNSEVGGGAFQLAPQVVVQVCRNGMTITREALRKQHLGGKLEEGVIQWSDDTQDKALALVRAQTRDAVRTFLDAGWLRAKVDELEAVAGVPVTDPPETIQFVGRKLAYDKDRQADLLRHFTLGGQMTAGGVAQAITSVAQTLDDADAAARMEAQAVDAMELVAAR